MKTKRFDPRHFADVIEEHKAWLRDFKTVRLQNWDKIFKADPEAAIVEACARKLLAEHVERVEPAEGVAKENGGPDFVCFQENRYFYVEVSSLEKEAVSRRTGLPPSASGSAQFYSDLSEAIFIKCNNKAKQCSGLDAPCLLLIGTLHFQGGCLCFQKNHLKSILTGISKISLTVDLETGQAVGEPKQVTNLDAASFLKHDENSSDLYLFARRSISGLLCCGFGSTRPVVNGVIHPNAARPFDRNLLSGISFGIVEEKPKGVLDVVWD